MILAKYSSAFLVFWSTTRTPRRLARFFIVNNFRHDFVYQQSQVARALGGGQRGGLRTEVRAVGAAPATHIAGHALPAAQSQMLGGGLREVRHPPDGDGAVHLFGNLFLEMLLHAGEVVRRQKLAVGQYLQTFTATADARETLDVAVPGGQILIADGPVHADALPGVGLEVLLVPAVRLPSPQYRTPALDGGAGPAEGAFLDVGVLYFTHKEAVGYLVAKAARPGPYRSSSCLFPAGRPVPGT